MLKFAYKRLGAIFLKPELVFATLAIPFGILSAIMVPQLSVADESMHFLKAYNLASGNLGAENCHYPQIIYDTAFSAHNGVYESNFTNMINLSHTEPGECGSAASYTPIMHIPQAIGIFIAKLINPTTGSMILLARLTNLLFFVAIIYYVIKKVKIGKWAFTVVALFPLSIHLAASLSADVMNNVIILAFIAFVFNLFVQKDKLSRKQLLILLILSCLLALTKATNIVLLFILLFLPRDLFSKNKLAAMPFNVKKWSVVLLCAVLSVLSLAGWQKAYNAPLASTTENALSNDPTRFPAIFYNTYVNPFLDYSDIVLRGIVGEFSSFQYHLPSSIVFLCLLTLLLAMLHKNKKEEVAIKKPSLPLITGSSGALALLIIAVTYAMYTVWATLPERFGPDAIYADGVQGRYFVAALTLLIPLFVWLRQFITVKMKSDKIFGATISFACAFFLLFYLAETFAFLV